MYNAYYLAYPSSFVVSSTTFGNGALGPGIGVPQGPGQVAFAPTIYGNYGFQAVPNGFGGRASGPVIGVGGKR